MPGNWTQAQERAIEARGNVIVSAAAGAGKTAVLTERLTRIVAAARRWTGCSCSPSRARRRRR